MTERGKAFWFTAGYLACMLVEIFSAELIRLIGDLLSEDATVEAVTSSNGAAATSRDAEIATESVERISEYTTEAKPSE